MTSSSSGPLAIGSHSPSSSSPRSHTFYSQRNYSSDSDDNDNKAATGSEAAPKPKPTGSKKGDLPAIGGISADDEKRPKQAAAAKTAAAEGKAESDHERRLRKRTTGVNAIKRTPEYVQATESCWLRGGNPPRPQTPDPTNLKISKRCWEASMQKWRRDLKNYPGSTEDSEAVLTPWPPPGGSPRRVEVVHCRRPWAVFSLEI